MPDETPDLPEEVLTELGRLTYAAILLEDVVYAMCAQLASRPWSLGKAPPIGPAIDQAILDAEALPSDVNATAVEWLTAAKSALEARNSVLHAVPVSWEPLPNTTVIPGMARDWLSHFPRNAAKQPVHTALTVDGLRPTLVRLQRAFSGWQEIALQVMDAKAGGPPGG